MGKDTKPPVLQHNDCKDCQVSERMMALTSAFTDFLGAEQDKSMKGIEAVIVLTSTSCSCRSFVSKGPAEARAAAALLPELADTMEQADRARRQGAS
jgi:hypothetical protein